MSRKQLKIAHFDLDRNFAKLFKEKKYFFPLSLKNLNLIKDLKELELVTVKSDSLINKEILKALPKLKAIITRTVGIDHLDLGACKQRKIAVYHIPDYGAFAVAEQVFALLLCQTRKIIKLSRETKLGKFNWQNGQGYTLKDKTLGIIGVGRTGKETAKIACGFQMKILGFDKFPDFKFAEQYHCRYVSLEALLKNSDIISINLPLVKSTYRFINEREIKKMKKGVILINVSRGEIVATEALIKNLSKFKYICLDVLENEKDYNLKNPLIKKLVNSPKVLLTPHVAFFTDETTKEIAKITYQNINYFLTGSSKNRII